MEIKTIAVIGAYTTGQAFAQASALAGYATVFEDVSREMLERGIAAVTRALEEAVTRGELSAHEQAEALTRIVPIVGVEQAIRDADLIIEAVPEELEMKLEMFTIFDKFAKPGAIFASTTQTLSVLDLSDVTVYRDRCIGMRFCEGREPGARFSGSSNPVALNRTCIELVATKLSSPETIAACRAVAYRLATEVRLVPDFISAS